MLDKYKICMNIGSACSLGKRSHVLTACGLPPELEKGLLRLSLSEYTTLKDCKYVVDVLSRLYYRKLNKIE
jgi:cysteine desulfurase